MKKFLTGILIAFLLMLCTLPVYAAEADKEVIYYDDGSYTIVTMDVVGVARATDKISANKVYNHCSPSGATEWKATMRATFTYTGSTATCTSVDSLSVSIYNDDWSLVSKSTRKSGATAYGDVVMERSIIGGTQGVPVTLTLTCDKNGNLS